MADTNNSRTMPESQRLTSLDALRGFDMFWILGADSFVAAVHEMGHNPVTKFFAEQVDHAEWAGFRFYDLIFPMFVFIMGVSTVFSLTKIIEREGRAAAVKRVLKRGVLLFIVALIYSGGFTNPWPDMRLMGVLNRIAICYTFGGLLFIFCNVRVMAAVAAALLLGYWALLAQVPFPDVRPTPGGDAVITREAGFKSVDQLNMNSTVMIKGSYIQGVNLANYIDQKYLPGRKYDGTYDPEGILSTMPALVTGLLGIFTGLFLRSRPVPVVNTALCLIGAGALSAALGWTWNLELPVIKKLWTSSYVLVAGGYAAMLLGLFYYLVDVKKWRTWCQPFIWIGMNPITLYLTSNFLGGLGFEKLARRLTGGPVKAFFDAHVAAGCGELVSALVGVLLFIWFARFLYQRKIFLRL
ncbi:MAG: heparan-alpha-glucosaminide N-acetyltransferase domain-containing protein [Verrucomicrobiae bacterium]|nr:heparan-alpha-glucosaminide N-acetyltransferase domain-containing protein [Verrucomicrobiae bacterium]